MSTPKKNETTAIRTQLAKSPFLEHSNPLYLTSSFVFDSSSLSCRSSRTTYQRGDQVQGQQASPTSGDRVVHRPK